MKPRLSLEGNNLSIEFPFAPGYLGAVASAAGEVTPEVTPEVARILAVIEGEMNRATLMARLGLKDEKHFRERYQQTALAAGLIEMTIPDKPTSRLQKYRLTAKGRAWLKSHSKKT